MSAIPTSVAVFARRTKAAAQLGFPQPASGGLRSRTTRSQPLAGARGGPGLAVLATADHVVGTEEQRRRAAGRAGAQFAVLDGLGHWWMTEDPARGAATLTKFWSTIR